MGKLIFCRDGILRLSEWFYETSKKSGRHVDIPLYLVEEHGDPFKFLKCLGAFVEFEDGLTVKEFFNNLAPWKEVMEGIACMDFEAFLEEVNKPCEKPLENLSHIEITQYISFEAVADFEGDLFADDMFEKVPGKKYYKMKDFKSKITDRVEMKSFWTQTCMLITPEDDGQGNKYDSVGLSYSPINEWAHVPMKIAKPRIHDQTYNSDYMSIKESLFNHNHPCVGEKHERLATLNIETDGPNFIDTVVYGFLWDVGFHYSPVSRDKFGEELKERADEVDEDFKSDVEFKDIISEIDDEPVDREPDQKEIYLRNLINKVSEIDATLLRYHEDKKR